ncbi:signal recognition particle-docking protein FtsY [Enterobacter sp. Ap-916]|uniref:signal recognition particle-docking protein FtsY n=1 Tax=unclassified Enterobacter TaxID=2608935 RepID=UPI0014216AE3|nr:MULTISPECIES: signal recognition particle-docking protein FtsY [unclassified Enterobacter]NIF59741.1 signal recognition particle-docking protein FtsY [Enterobacter sp. Ap-867]NIG31287.1 signal recognition particle-docking protein FtsY [Enterobacter sp. Ap-916]
MAKEKKRGFFSWLGFGQKEQQPDVEAEQKVIEEQPVTEQAPAQDESQQPQAVEQEQQDLVSEHSLEESEKFAEQVVEVNAQLAEEAEEKALTAEPEMIPEPEVTVEPEIVAEPEPVAVIEPEPVVEPEAVVEPEVIEPAAVIAEPEVIEQPVAAVEHETLPLPEEIAENVDQPDEWQAEQDEIVNEEVAEAEALFAHEAAVEDEAVAEEAVDEEPEEEAVEETAPVAVQQEQEKPTKEGFFARLKRSLVKTKQNLGSGFISLFRGKKIDDDLFEELEEQLLIADVGVETTRKIITNLTEGASRKQLRDAEALYGLLKEEMSEILAKVDEPLSVEGKTPFVILMVGVNGVGKTTTIGKLARQFEQQGKSVMLAAGDTFRAAAVEQLQVWGQRNNIPVVAQHTGADSASVIFDAIQAAKARNIDVLIADTAGRLQNKSHLMEELKKIVRVMKKLDEDAPHEVMLTLDASTGQNAISQAKLFHEAVGLTGITLTKLDGTAKGGVIFSVADQFGIPIRYIGVGEQISDLRPFNAGDFIEALFARED